MNSALARSIADLSSRWRNRFSRSKRSSDHLRRGFLGENLAGRFLHKNGYKVLYRNFRGRSGGVVLLAAAGQGRPRLAAHAR